MTTEVRDWKSDFKSPNRATIRHSALSRLDQLEALSMPKGNPQSAIRNR